MDYYTHYIGPAMFLPVPDTCLPDLFGMGQSMSIIKKDGTQYRSLWNTNNSEKSLYDRHFVL